MLDGEKVGEFCTEKERKVYKNVYTYIYRCKPSNRLTMRKRAESGLCAAFWHRRGVRPAEPISHALFSPVWLLLPSAAREMEREREARAP